MRKKIALPRGWRECLPDTTPGERLKKCRVAKNLTQAHLAVLVDIPQTTLSKLERGESFFSTEDAKIFAEALETTSEYLLYGAPKNEGGGGKPEGWANSICGRHSRRREHQRCCFRLVRIRY